MDLQTWGTPLHSGHPLGEKAAMNFCLKLAWAMALLVSLGVGCTLITEVDRSKIDDGGGAGESNSSDSSDSGE
jgi:hypothetical protein